tara:strand:- start:3603 stop:5054 length:1452 start_codon:yes stop_codon:yes gene_type:complete
MQTLKNILSDLKVTKILGSKNIHIKNILYNSKKVSKDSLFVAIKGQGTDGHLYIEDAIRNKANSIICEVLPNQIERDVTYIQVPDTQKTLAIIASNFYGSPSKKIKLIGVTGTNGKTSTVFFLKQLFEKLGNKVGMISTIHVEINNQIFDSTHTTHCSLKTNKLLRKMVDTGCDYCFMEVSSHGLSQNRVFFLDFDIGVFTNISHDHLDYHNSFENYLNSKKYFFDELSKNAKSIINIDDLNFPKLIKDTKSKKFFYGKSKLANNTGLILNSDLDGIELLINGTALSTKISGDFNLYNILATFSVAVEMGYSEKLILKLISSLEPVPGRFNIIKSKKNIYGIVDYAHTPDALQEVIKSVSNYCDIQKQLIIVCGCGGNRDQSKRPEMGNIASINSFKTVFTSDNPRSEDPVLILNDIKSGVLKKHLNKTHFISNRLKAIEFAVSMARDKSIILLTGKGHEQFQEKNGIKVPFDDYKILHNLLK